ncbi:MAG: AAA family ATPase [Oscillospiraceae bacterium]|nr:AAA family ATPase [Oscillospiraceae bacterium]
MARKKKTDTEPDVFATYLSDVDKEKTDWLIPHWIPRGAITLLVGDGGVGKTSLWCYLISRISCGETTMLTEDFEPEDAEPQILPNRVCMYFSAEDSTSRRLKGQFEKYEADQSKIVTVRMEHLLGLDYGSEALERLIKEYRPAICVFDPMQAFMPDDSSMTSRQQSREALTNLVRLGAQYDTAFLLVCHTNKRRTEDWRQRITGSADLPDIARSVLFTDYTEIKAQHAIRFLSNEKNSYHMPQETVLYEFDENGAIAFRGLTGKKFADYAADEPWQPKEKQKEKRSQKEICKETMLAVLDDGKEVLIKDLSAELGEAGFSEKVIASARAELVHDGLLTRRREAGGSGSIWYIKRAERAKEPEC